MITKEESLILNLLLSKRGYLENNQTEIKKTRKNTRKEINCAVQADLRKLLSLQAIKKIC